MIMKTKYIKVSVKGDKLFQKVSQLLNGRTLIKNGECIEWGMYKNSCGYGMGRYKGKLWTISRLIYQLYYEIDLKDKHVLHRCDNPACVNPIHLFLGDHQQNMNDKVAKGRSKTGTSSKYRFVSYRKDSGKWRVSKNIKGKMASFGQFDTEEEAGEFVKNNLLNELKQTK